MSTQNILKPAERKITDVYYIGETILIEKTDKNAGWTKLHDKVYNKELEKNDIINLTPLEIDHRDKYGQSALWIACNRCSQPSIDLLVNAGANLQQTDNQKRNLLHAVASSYTSYRDCEQVAIYLLKNGVDPYAKDILGKTMLDDLEQKPSIIKQTTMYYYEIRQKLRRKLLELINKKSKL